MACFRRPTFRGLGAIALLLSIGQISRLWADTVTGTTGASAPVENRQPTLTTRYMIALQGNFPTNGGSNLDEVQPPNRISPFLGEIKAIPFEFAPQGWALCEGQTLTINQNTPLFSLLGTSFGGNGTTNFKLPDLRSRVPLGTGQGFGLPNYVLGQQVGAANPSLTAANLPSHTHTVPGGPNTFATGSGAAVDNRQPALALSFFIAADGEILITGFTRTPDGWTPCDGHVLPVAGHGYAYANIGSAYGGDGGFSSFAVPDLRGRVIIGDDSTSAFPLGKVFGSNDLVLGVADIAAHNHTVNGGTLTGSTGGPGNTASNYQPGLVLRQLISLFGDYPSPNNGVNFPMMAEMRVIAGPSSSGLSGNQWKTMYGELYSIAQNQALFSLLGTDYGGNGQTTFAAPDLRARADEAVDFNLPRGSVVGWPTLDINVSQLPAHAHALVNFNFTGVQHFGDDHVLLTLQGYVGSTAQVDKSDDLVGWSSLGQVNFTTATQTIPDPNPTHLPKRFYRAHIP